MKVWACGRDHGTFYVNWPDDVAMICPCGIEAVDEAEWARRQAALVTEPEGKDE